MHNIHFRFEDTVHGQRCVPPFKYALGLTVQDIVLEPAVDRSAELAESWSAQAAKREARKARLMAATVSALGTGGGGHAAHGRDATHVTAAPAALAKRPSSRLTDRVRSLSLNSTSGGSGGDDGSGDGDDAAHERRSNGVVNVAAVRQLLKSARSRGGSTDGKASETAAGASAPAEGGGDDSKPNPSDYMNVPVAEPYVFRSRRSGVGVTTAADEKPAAVSAATARLEGTGGGGAAGVQHMFDTIGAGVHGGLKQVA